MTLESICAAVINDAELLEHFGINAPKEALKAYATDYIKLRTAKEFPFLQSTVKQKRKTAPDCNRKAAQKENSLSHNVNYT